MLSHFIQLVILNRTKNSIHLESINVVINAGETI